MGRRIRGEGGATTVEFVLLTPILFFVIFATVQFGLYFFARHVAIAAAQAGSRVARAEAGDFPESDAWHGPATAKTRDYVRQLGPNMLENVAETPVYDPGGEDSEAVVGVQVDADVPRILPGFDFHITVVSQGPVERFVPDE
jgi:hypothetical protein